MYILHYVAVLLVFALSGHSELLVGKCFHLIGLQPYPLIGPSEIGDYIKSGKVLDKPQLSSDEM